MSAREQSAVAIPEVETEQAADEQTARGKPKRQPPYAVVVLNDDEHTFQYVMETFRKIFGYSAEKCFRLATEIHTQGRSIVWSGWKEIAELKRDQIRASGPDVYAEKKVKFPLGVLIESMPQ